MDLNDSEESESEEEEIIVKGKGKVKATGKGKVVKGEKKEVKRRSSKACKFHYLNISQYCNQKANNSFSFLFSVVFFIYYYFCLLLQLIILFRFEFNIGDPCRKSKYVAPPLSPEIRSLKLTVILFLFRCKCTRDLEGPNNEPDSKCHNCITTGSNCTYFGESR